MRIYLVRIPRRKGHYWFAPTGHRRCPGQQRLPDSAGTNGPQVAMGQVAVGAQGQIFQGGFGVPRPVRRAGAVEPIDAVQALLLGALNPEGDGSDADAELRGDGAEELTVADGGNHSSATLRLTLCWLMELLPNGSALG